MSTTTDDRQATSSQSLQTSKTHAKTLKNRKYRLLQKDKRNATKSDQIEKLLTLNKEKSENLEKIERLVREGSAKDERIAELSELLKKSQENVKLLEKITEAYQEDEMLLEFWFDLLKKKL